MTIGDHFFIDLALVLWCFGFGITTVSLAVLHRQRGVMLRDDRIELRQARQRIDDLIAALAEAAGKPSPFTTAPPPVLSQRGGSPRGRWPGFAPMSPSAFIDDDVPPIE